MNEQRIQPRLVLRQLANQSVGALGGLHQAAQQFLERRPQTAIAQQARLRPVDALQQPVAPRQLRLGRRSEEVGRRRAGGAHAHFPQAYARGDCHLCHIPINTIHDHCPCLHWLTNAYANVSRLQPVLDQYGLRAAVHYLALCALSMALNERAARIGGADTPDPSLLEAAAEASFWADAIAEYRLGFVAAAKLHLRPDRPDARRGDEQTAALLALASSLGDKHAMQMLMVLARMEAA